MIKKIKPMWNSKMYKIIETDDKLVKAGDVFVCKSKVIGTTVFVAVDVKNDYMTLISLHSFNRFDNVNIINYTVERCFNKLLNCYDSAEYYESDEYRLKIERR